MSIIEKVCGKIGLGGVEDTAAGEKAEERVQETPAERAARTIPRFDNVVDIHAAAEQKVLSKMKVIVIEPRSFDDVQQVANCLKEKKPVVINFEHTDAEDAKRIIDFVSGTTYALSGDLKKVGRNVFLCAPSNVNVAYSQERQSANDMPWLRK